MYSGLPFRHRGEIERKERIHGRKDFKNMLRVILASFCNVVFCCTGQNSSNVRGTYISRSAISCKG